MTAPKVSPFTQPQCDPIAPGATTARGIHWLISPRSTPGIAAPIALGSTISSMPRLGSPCGSRWQGVRTSCWKRTRRGKPEARWGRSSSGRRMPVSTCSMRPRVEPVMPAATTPITGHARSWVRWSSRVPRPTISWRTASSGPPVSSSIHMLHLKNASKRWRGYGVV